MPNRPLLTIAQVVDQFDLSRATVRRGIDSGKFEGAHKDAQGRWIVPVEALVVAGIKPRKTWLDNGAHEHAQHGAHEHNQSAHSLTDPIQTKVATEHVQSKNELAHHASRIAQLEAELSTEKQLRAAAERNSEDLRTALRMIEAGTTAPATADSSASANKQRRRWWQIR